MTLLQNVAIFAIGIVAELIVLFFAAMFFAETNNEEQLRVGLVLLNALLIIGILLAWANGIKFPLK